MNLNDRIKNVRKSTGLNQTDFGHRLGVTTSSIAKLEGGVNNPSEQTIKLICKEFGVSPVWLKTGDGEMLEAKTIEDDVDLIDRLMSGEDEFAKDIFRSFAKLSPESWRKLREVVDELRQKK